MKKSLLIVEDDPDIRCGVEEILTHEGYRVRTARNGQVALEALRTQGEELPGLILLDLMMPVKDGYSFREEQSKDPGINHIPVVVMSAVPQVNPDELNLAPQNLLRKPLDLSELFETVEYYLSDEKVH